jgi:hypothetical protein
VRVHLQGVGTLDAASQVLQSSNEGLLFSLVVRGSCRELKTFSFLLAGHWGLASFEAFSSRILTAF